MRKFYLITVLALVFGLAGSTLGDQVKVNIVYPINGGTYPVTDPAPPRLNSAYIPASFSVTCKGGGHRVKWGFDAMALGNAEFYDEISIQFVHKLPGGEHVFWVRSDCGENKVKFRVGR